MSDEHLETEIHDLKRAYGAVARATAADGRQLIRIDDADLPRGCRPTGTPVLLVLQNGSRPQVFVKPGIVLSNGIAPRSTSNVAVEGETWLQFSFNFAWSEGSQTLVQFVAASLRRFALTE